MIRACSHRELRHGPPRVHRLGALASACAAALGLGVGGCSLALDLDDQIKCSADSDCPYNAGQGSCVDGFCRPPGAFDSTGATAADHPHDGVLSPERLTDQGVRRRLRDLRRRFVGETHHVDWFGDATNPGPFGYRITGSASSVPVPLRLPTSPRNGIPWGLARGFNAMKRMDVGFGRSASWAALAANARGTAAVC